ncbi:unnamed protein product [Symbiodinium natans]|uniref:Uncharacterized protein n=1 Tax=Symbiodinium natans TaxID=878477 RepID=A0A812V0B8_9DINO|nr:unnamed protein product [Symbiodinium natans]
MATIIKAAPDDCAQPQLEASLQEFEATSEPTDLGEGEGAALLGGAFRPEFFRRSRPCAALGLLLGLALVTLAGLLLVPEQGEVSSQTSARLSEAEMQSTTPDKFWLMCPNADCVWLGKTGSEWIYSFLPKSPWTLADEIDDGVSWLASVPQDMWNQVRNKWMQSPPMFQGTPVTIQELANFMRATLRRDPFSTGGQKVPWIDLREGGAGGPVHSQQKAIIINHRQLAFLIINSLHGNKLEGIETGLDAALARCSGVNSAPGLTPDMLYSLLAYLAILSRELVGDQDGTYLVGTTPGPANNQWLQQLAVGKMQPVTLCNHERLGAGTCGLSDFMAAGVPFQALTDIAGQDVGGGAQLCHVANSQDESLVIFYPEVLAFAAFVGNGRMLPVPFTLLGARRYLNTIYGETGVGPPFQNLCGKVAVDNLLNENILTQDVKTRVSLTPLSMKAASFVAVASYCSDCHRGECSEPDMFNNLCDAQRRHLDQDISLWLQAYNSANYTVPSRGPRRHCQAHRHRTMGRRIVARGLPTVLPGSLGGHEYATGRVALRVLGAGVLLNHVALDYYIYDHFCENAGHQCFVLPKELCQTCIQLSGMSSVIDASRCGYTGAQDMVDRMTGRQVQDIYFLLRDIGPPPDQAVPARFESSERPPHTFFTDCLGQVFELMSGMAQFPALGEFCSAVLFRGLAFCIFISPSS